MLLQEMKVLSEIFLLDYIQKEQGIWKAKPEIITGDLDQDCIILKFGTPRPPSWPTWIPSGLAVRYGKELINKIVENGSTNGYIQLVEK